MSEIEEALAEIELSRSLSDAEKAAYDVQSAELEVERKKLELQESRINMGYELSGHYLFDKRVDEKSMRKLYQKMWIWDSQDATGRWVIDLNSTGGYAYNCWGIIDGLRAHSLRGGGTHHITIRVRGIAASAAGMILQAADHRVMGSESMLMIHRGSSGVIGAAHDIEDEAEWHRRSTDQMISLFLSRTDKITRPEFLRKVNRRDWWLTSTEALDLGFVDEIG